MPARSSRHDRPLLPSPRVLTNRAVPWAESHLQLRRRSRFRTATQLAIRLAVMAALLALIIGFHWLERDSLKDMHDGQISFADIIYFTMISATTTGYGDIVPITERARLFDALVVTPIRVFFLLLLAGTAYSFFIKRLWDKYLMRRLQKGLNDHIIVAGFGSSGSEAVAELVARGCDPTELVVIDCDEEALAQAHALGCMVLQGDATRDATLQAVHVERARALLVTAGRDDTSILVCLTARHLAPDLPITVSVRASDNELPARAAGASTVINPVSFAGLLMAGSAQGSGVADYLADLASARGRVQLRERTVAADEVGQPLGDIRTGIGLRILRGQDSISFEDPGACTLQAGDRIIELTGQGAPRASGGSALSA
ncbi:TrkA family potassium uptake protein [Sphingomonas sp. LHG3406-1]|uniref:potassium channel family protein n=1 Tax=Sphingomonas sp. LHG3406-1 TaxID=2804617 RepID=UPI00262B5859|nr:potassium channel family protein [Sphingomonas sp. LHG3406-1]